MQELIEPVSSNSSQSLNGSLLKIVHITFNFPPDMGGVGAYVQNLSRFLTEQNVEVAVIALPTQLNLNPTGQPNAPTYRLKVLKLPLSDPIPLNLLWILRTLLKTKKRKIIHLHGHCTFLSLVGAFCCNLLKISYVVTHHGEGLEISTLSKINGALRREVIAKYVLRNSKLVISVTENEAATLMTRYRVPKNRILVLHNGVNSNEFDLSPKYNVLPKEWLGKKVIYNGGIIAQWKGLEYLVKAMKLVVDQCEDARLMITGDGPDRIRLQNLINSLGLGEYIKFLGRVEPTFLPSFYNSSCMFVLPSLYDVCPTTVLEAMASRKPVIITSNGGQKELVVDNVNGIVIPPADPGELAKAILTILSSKKLAFEMGCQGRKIVEEKFEWSKIGRRMLQAYGTL